jgi:hypothetical protein
MFNNLENVIYSMPLTESEQYYLARFLSNRHGISLERAIEFIKDPEVDCWDDYEFVSRPLKFEHKTASGNFSEEFLEREEQLEVMTKFYCQKNPLSAETFISLVQVTPNKETELDLGTTRTWYEDTQVEEIVSELKSATEWLKSNVYDEENVPKDNAHLYDLNLAIMLYGLDNSESRISVDYMNGHHTLRSSPHTRGYISEETYSSHARSVGMRLANIFTEGNKDTIEDIDSLSDEIVDELFEYYEGPVRQLVRKVEESLTHYNNSE